MIKKVFMILLISCFSAAPLMARNNIIVPAPDAVPTSENPPALTDHHYEVGKELNNAAADLLDRLDKFAVQAEEENIFTIDEAKPDGHGLRTVMQIHFADMASFETAAIAPGCLSDFLQSSSLIVFSNYFFIWTVDAVNYSETFSCAGLYGSLSLINLYLGLVKWIDYRICALEFADEPNPELSAQLSDDRSLLLLAAAPLILPALYFGIKCDTPLLRYLFPYFYSGGYEGRDWDDYYDDYDSY